LTSEYNRWPDKAGPSRRNFGWAVDRSIQSLSTNFGAVDTGRSLVRTDKSNVLNFEVFLYQDLSTEFGEVGTERSPVRTDESYVLNYEVFLYQGLSTEFGAVGTGRKSCPD